jgi:CheY-like chemotaxis protein
MAYVLIVDDSADTCEVLARFLSRSGYRAKCVPNGREALAAVVRSPPDAVILDLCMADMDGPAFLEALRSPLRLKSLPVVVLTALPDGPMAERVRSLKVSSILGKGRATLADVEQAVCGAIHGGRS